MNTVTLAERLFDGEFAKCDLEEMLSSNDVPFETVGWDSYDCSVGIHGVPADYRMPPDVQQALRNHGFSKAYVNHVDKWETHYDFRNDDFNGWRVSYPRNRGEEGGIWVEKIVPTWPPVWFENGYVQIKEPPQ